MTLKQSQDHQTYNENAEPEQGYNKQSLKDHAFTVSKKKQYESHFQMRKYVNYFP